MKKFFMIAAICALTAGMTATFTSCKKAEVKSVFDANASLAENAKKAVDAIENAAKDKNIDAFVQGMKDLSSVFGKVETVEDMQTVGTVLDATGSSNAPDEFKKTLKGDDLKKYEDAEAAMKEAMAQAAAKVQASAQATAEAAAAEQNAALEEAAAQGAEAALEGVAEGLDEAAAEMGEEE